MPKIPTELIVELVRRLKEVDNHPAVQKVRQEIIEDMAHDWVDKHPDTLWTGLELIDALKEISEGQ